MQVTSQDISNTKVRITIIADDKELAIIKNDVLLKFQPKTKVAGFRTGKAPLKVIEKQVDPNVLQAEFIDEAINNLYQSAVTKEQLKAFGRSNVTLKKFVPFTNLEFDVEVEVLGKVKLADYKKIKKNIKKVEVSAKDVRDVVNDLKKRTAKKEAVKRASKYGDEVVIDFKGEDTANKPINGADGKDYPLILGSNTFIPGFEDNIIGLKEGNKKTFTLKFPKDYGVKTLANKKVIFTVTVKAVNQLNEPKLDDDFAKKVGPFNSMDELKTDIKKQLKAEKQNQANRQLENELILEIVNNSKLSLPETLVSEQIENLKNEIRQNLIYKGQTWQEMLDNENLTDTEFEKQQLLPEAKRRVKTGLVLAEISIEEKIDVSSQEIEDRMQSLKEQYTDAKMQAELEKPESRQEIASRLLTEKTIKLLVKMSTS